MGLLWICKYQSILVLKPDANSSTLPNMESRNFPKHKAGEWGPQGTY